MSDKSRNLVVVPGQPSASVSVARPQPWVSVFTAPYMYVRRYVLHCIYSVLLNWVYSKAWRANKTGTSLVCILRVLTAHFASRKIGTNVIVGSHFFYTHSSQGNWSFQPGTNCLRRFSASYTDCIITCLLTS